jgi:hypothetical protein
MIFEPVTVSVSQKPYAKSFVVTNPHVNYDARRNVSQKENQYACQKRLVVVWNLRRCYDNVALFIVALNVVPFHVAVPCCIWWLAVCYERRNGIPTCAREIFHRAALCSGRRLLCRTHLRGPIDARHLPSGYDDICQRQD